MQSIASIVVNGWQTVRGQMADSWGDWRSEFWALLERQVFPVASTDRLFNPYSGEHPDLDVQGAAATRRSNLYNYFDCFGAPPRVIFVAEAPGPWGCRFSGVPITSESQLVDPEFPIAGARTAAGRDEPLREYSASIFWRNLQDVFPAFLVWNTVPFHPHKPGEPLSIRTPTAAEIRRGSELLAPLCELTGSDYIFAVGRKAENALASVGVEAQYVRHPSQGGAVRFSESVRSFVASNPWMRNRHHE